MPGCIALSATEPEPSARRGLIGRLADRGEVAESTVRPAAEAERVPIFTLPGNPVSAYVSFQVFTRPALGALQADDGLGLERIQAELTGPLRSPAGRRSFLRGVLDRPAGLLTPLTGQGSHQVATLGKANALVVVPEDVVALAAGEMVDVLVLP
jgi:molybdopterin molybdotransferase